MYEERIIEKPLTSVWVYVASKDTYRCVKCGAEIPFKELKQHRTCPGCGASMRKSG